MHAATKLVRVVVALALLLATTPAWARRASDHSSELDAAQRALGDLRYEEARALLERAWHSGDNGPGALALLFRLQGEVAATLGDAPGARRAFARWLAIEPAAHLDEGASPKFVAPFDAARTQLGGSWLRVDVEVAPDGSAVTLVVIADPLAMVVGARVSYTGEGGLQSVVEGKGGPRIGLPLPTADHLRVVVAALDGFGNRVIEREVLVAPEKPRPPARPVLTPSDEPAAPPSAPSAPARPLLARPWLWTGVAAGLALVGGVFVWRVADAEDELAALNADSAGHSFAEARALDDRRHTSATLAYASFGAAGASLVLALVLAAAGAGPEPASHLGFAPAPGGGRVSFEWSF
jgi:hypothetical protein